jgi:predicted AlkP superfamily pyrophosphatase or phosphodiesterase
MPDAVLGCFSNWNPINYGLVDDEKTTKDTGDDEGLCERICAYVKNEKPTFLFIQFDSVDGAGHAHGYGSPLHLNQINVCDGYAGRIYEAYREAGILEDTLFIVTTDHGGYGRGHGSDTDEEKFVFFVMVGKTVNNVKVPFMQTRSIPAITTYALGIPGNANWQSYLPDGAFTE